MEISRRARTIQESPIRKLAPLIQSARGRGVSIHHLNIGQPDIATPQAYMDAVSKFHDPVLSYGPSDGLPEMKQAIADYFGRYGIPIEPRETFITTGGSEAILFAFNVVGDTGDQVLIPEPFYTNYNGFASMASMKVVPLTTHAQDGFALPPPEAFERAITSRTRAILICSPNNPTGHIASWEELKALAEVARRHDLFLIGDEVYKEFTYDGATHRSLLELPGMEDRVIVVDSISKRFSACGARIGALICRNRQVIESVLKFGQARLCPPTLEQVGAIAAYNMAPSYFDPIRAEYQRRRDTLREGLTADPSVLLKKPSGAFYMMAALDIPDTDKFARWLLTDFDIDGETVMVAPGDGFYATEGKGRNEIRVAYVLECDRLERAARIVVEGLKKFRGLKA